MVKEKAAVLTQEFKHNREGRPIRTTLFLSEGLNLCLDYYALMNRLPKGEIVRDALGAYLKQKGYEPRRIPGILNRMRKAG